MPKPPRDLTSEPQLAMHAAHSALAAGGAAALAPALAHAAPGDTLAAAADTLAVPGAAAAPAGSVLDTLLAAIGVAGPDAAPSRLVIVPLLILAYTLLASIALRLVFAGGRRWRAWLVRTLQGRVGAVSVRGFELISVKQITRAFAAVLGRADLLVALVVASAWLTAVTELFPWSHGIGASLVQFVASRALDLARAIVAALPGLLTIAVIVFVFRGIMWLSDRFFDAVAAGTLDLGHMHPELAVPSKRLARIALWVVAITLSYPHIPGSQSRTVQGVSILLGIMASLGSTGFVSNVIAGVVLTYSRAFREGDRVKLGEHVGDVVSLGFLATKLRSLRNEEITLPNGQVAQLPVVNYTRLAGEDGLILYTSVTIGYDAEWRRVHELLIEAALRVDGVEKSPVPWVWQRSLNDSHITYELNCVTRQSHPQLRLYSELHQEIQDAFARAGVEILSPMYHAVRDANSAILPAQPAGPRPEPGGFRVRGGGGDGGRAS